MRWVFDEKNSKISDFLYDFHSYKILRTLEKNWILSFQIMMLVK